MHIACGLRFRVSLDNLGDQAGDGAVFKDRVFGQAAAYVRDGVSERAARLYAAFAVAFGGPRELAAIVLSRAELD